MTMAAPSWAQLRSPLGQVGLPKVGGAVGGLVDVVIQLLQGRTGLIWRQQGAAAPGQAFGFAKVQVRDAEKPGSRPEQRARGQGVQGDIGPQQRASYCEATTTFIDDNQVTHRLASLRTTISAKFNLELGSDDMDDIERALQDITYWKPR